MKIILFLALITLATCELYHYQECVRGTTVLLKERSVSPKLFIRQEEVQELYSPIFLIVAAIVFITLCFTLKRKTE